MGDLIGILKSFNRKERFFLIARALGKPEFELSEDFREELGNKIGLEVPEDPEKVFVAMDYHLNWLHASLVLAHSTNTITRMQLLNNGAIKNNQEDVDLLVAFKDSTEQEKYYLILIEAKGYYAKGFSSFGKSQLVSKIKRLNYILKPHSNVVSYYCLMSGYQPGNLHSNGWPKLMGQPLMWLELSLPSERHVVDFAPSIYELNRDIDAKRFARKTIVPPKT